jgi:hypothetical protein
MSDTPDDEGSSLERQDLALDPDGMLDVPDAVEKSERAEQDKDERRKDNDEERAFRPC